MAAAAASLGLAAQAPAATVDAVGNELNVTSGDEGESNYIVITTQPDGDFRVEDYRGTPTAGPGCRSVAEADATPENNPVICSSAGIERTQVSLGDRNDQLAADARVPALTYSGGSGIDSYGLSSPSAVSLDGAANDGPSGRDNIEPDVEVLGGTAFGDQLFGGPAGVVLYGNEGDDGLHGGAGDDTIDAATVSGSGEDLGQIYGEGKDTVTCGDGNDQVFMDEDDSAASDCEVIGKPGRQTDTGLTFSYTGSPASDAIYVDEFVNAIVRAGGGNDVVRLAAETPDAVIYGQGGSDNLRASGGRDRFYGGSGNDKITSRTRDNERDTVRCGSGRDRVIADRADRVARDCEIVSRPPRRRR